ncbi:MAG: polyhydroxyalkanoic acid system family protein [Planctomycetota bacterium]
MPGFDVSVPHSLDRAEATERLKGFSEKIKQQMGDQVSDLEQSWDGDCLSFGFSTFGFRITGDLTVDDDAIAVKGDLPFAAAMFKGKITSAIKEQIAKILG